MSSCPRWPWEWGGHVDASNRYLQTRTNQRTYENPNRAGQRQHYVFKTNPFTIPLPCYQRNPASCARLRILAECVRGASPGLRWLKSAQITSPIVNAFLTLSAVTKW